MRRININTNQNVTINYELASLSDRCLSYLLDLIFIGTSILLITLILNLFGGASKLVYGVIFIPIILFYSLVTEIIFAGQTFGKKLMKLKTTHLSGNSLSLINYSTRWAFRVIDITVTLGSVACVMILSSSKKQRLGDLISDTVVIKLTDSQSIELEDILKINNHTEYQLKYPSVNLLAEDQVILIKRTLVRHAEHKNKAHKEALDQLAKKINYLLNINIDIDNSQQFLKDILKDYIIYTR